MSIVPLPIGKHVIGFKWVYKTKLKPDGSVERHKARLVAKGYNQQDSIDFLKTFSPVAKLVTIKVLLALAASFSWKLIQLDVNNAFLNGDLFEKVYMDTPLGHHQRQSLTSQCSKMVYLLHKSLYRLKQDSRQWYSKFSHAFIDLGFSQSKYDYSLFIKGQGSTFVALLVCR